MKFTPGRISGVVLIDQDVFRDERGYFTQSYRYDLFRKNGIKARFVQDNYSRSKKGTIRGLHYQSKPKEQAKLVRVTQGKAFDVVVDVRKGSKTFGAWEGYELSAENQKMLYIPAGCAHGFLAMADDTDVFYKVSNFYSPQHECGLRWDDSEVGIDWPKIHAKFTLSDKDKTFPGLRELR